MFQVKRSLSFLAAVGVATALSACSKAPAPTATPDPAITAALSAATAAAMAVRDRDQIEQLFVDYYSQLGAARHDFGAFFAPDGSVDINGMTAQGQAGIEALYKQAADENPPRQGVFRMLLNNLRVTVDGETATADVIWTGIINVNIKDPPVFVEQGREKAELIKLDGRWLFKSRVVTADSGLDPRSIFARSYKPR